MTHRMRMAAPMCLNQRFSARGSFAGMATRLERYVDSCTFGGFTSLAAIGKSLTLSMEFAKSGMPAFADNSTIAYHNCSNKRVGIDPPGTAHSKLQSSLHVLLVSQGTAPPFIFVVANTILSG